MDTTPAAYDTETDQPWHLDPEFKAKWLAALRSGDYLQIKSALTGVPAVMTGEPTEEDEDEWGDCDLMDFLQPVPDAPAQFCCLGVACDLTDGTWDDSPLYADEGDGYFLIRGFNTASGGYCEAQATDNFDFLPNTVCLRESADQRYPTKVSQYLASMNDSGDTFEDIANWIEENL